MDHPIVEVHHDTDFNPSSNLLLLADNRTGLCRLMTMICSPGWIHKPRLHHTYGDFPPTPRPLIIYNTRSTFKDDDVVYYVSRADRRLERAPQVDGGDNEGINEAYTVFVV